MVRYLLAGSMWWMINDHESAPEASIDRTATTHAKTSNMEIHTHTQSCVRSANGDWKMLERNALALHAM